MVQKEYFDNSNNIWDSVKKIPPTSKFDNKTKIYISGISKV